MDEADQAELDSMFPSDKAPATSFIGDAEAILAVNDDADQGILDLVDAYKSQEWDDPKAALDTVYTYANKLRQKSPGEANLLSKDDTLQIAPVKPEEVDNYIEQWETKNQAAIKESTDPMIRAYQDQLGTAIEDAATQSIKEANVDTVGQFGDKVARIAQGAFPGLVRSLGVEKYVERQQRADSDDTFASTLASAAGTVLTLPLSVPVIGLNLAANSYEFGKEKYDKALQSGATEEEAASAAAIEGLNQAADVILDRVLLGAKAAKEAPGIVKHALKTGTYEGSQEYAQNKISQYADYVGLNREEYGDLFNKQDLYAAGAGFIVGGGVAGAQAAANRPPPGEPGLGDTLEGEAERFSGVEQPQGGSTLAEDLGFYNPYRETEPVNEVAVVGEAVHGSSNETLVKDASAGNVGEVDGPVVATTENEAILLNPDGTTSRVIEGEKKQAHSGAVLVSPETAEKLATLQTAAPNGKPVIIKYDDLGRPYIQHPNVLPDLTVDENANNPFPVMIPEDDNGHVLQFSNRYSEYGSVEHSSTLSKGTTTGVSTAGAQQIKESSIADKLRQSSVLNENVKELLDLNTDFAVPLTYAPGTNQGNLQKVDNLMSRYENNYVLFANDVLSKSFGELDAVEGVAAFKAAEQFSMAAESIRAENPAMADRYDALSAQMFIAAKSVKSFLGQDLQMQSLNTYTPGAFVAATKFQLDELATAKAAVEKGVTVEEVQNAQADTKKIDLLEQGLNEREQQINEAEKAAVEREFAPDSKVEELQKAIIAVDNEITPEEHAAQVALDEHEAKLKEVEDRAKQLEKEAEELHNRVEEQDTRVKALEEEIKRLEEAKVDETPAVVTQKEKIETLKEEKKKVAKPAEAETVKVATETAKTAKNPAEKAKARLEATKALSDAKLAAKKAQAELEAQIKKEEAELDRQIAEAKEARKQEIRAKKEELQRAKTEPKVKKSRAVALKLKKAQRMRNNFVRTRSKKISALKELKKRAIPEKKIKKERLNLELDAIKEERKANKKIRAEQRKAEMEKIRQARQALKQDRERLDERKAHNKAIKDAVDKYRQEFRNRLTPKEAARISELAQLAQTATGNLKEQILEELGRTIARIKGINIVPGSDPWSTFWVSNTLSSLSTNVANIAGNVASPIRQVGLDLILGRPKVAARFIKGWVGAVLSKQTLTDTAAGLRGELPSRTFEDHTEDDIKDLASGITVVKERDPVKSLQLKFGTGKLGKLLSSPAMSLRMLGAMDALFARASQEGRTAREAPTFKEYLDRKAAAYSKYVTQARNEEAKLQSLGVPTPKRFVQARADELAFNDLPENTRSTIVKNVRRDVFQDPEGPRGYTATFVNKILQSVANVPIKKSSITDVNSSSRVATALGFANKSARGLEEIHAIVNQGLAEGQHLVINGEVIGNNSLSTEKILGNIVKAMQKNQVISLKGDSIKPFKKAIGAFLNISSQLLDANMEMLPVVGFVDKLGSFKEYTAEEKLQLYGTQLASIALTAGILGTMWDDMDDEPNAKVYIYGGMLDENLRKDYEAKGIKPFSVRVGTKIISYKDIPYLGLLLAGIGSISDARMVAKRTPNNPLTVGASLQAASLGAMYGATQLSTLKNITVLADLLAVTKSTDGSGAERAIRSLADVMSNVASNYVPFSAAGREVERFVYGDLSRPKDLMNRMMQNIPFVKFVSKNEPALNIFAEPIREHVTPGVSRFIGNYKQSFEIDWLLRNGYKISLPKAGTKLTDNQKEQYADVRASKDPSVFEDYLTEEDQRKYYKQFGPQLKLLLGKYARRYPQGFDADVQSELDSDIKELKSDVKDTVLRGY